MPFTLFQTGQLEVCWSQCGGLGEACCRRQQEEEMPGADMGEEAMLAGGQGARMGRRT